MATAVIMKLATQQTTNSSHMSTDFRLNWATFNITGQQMY